MRSNFVSSAPPLQALLFRQLCALGWLAGLFHPLYPLPASSVLVIALCVDTRLLGIFFEYGAKKQDALSRHIARSLLVFACFILGSVSVRTALPDAPPIPAWLDETQTAGKTPRLRGVIEQVQGLPDARLRIVLRDLRPAADPSAPVLQSLTLLTWEYPSVRPGTGQIFEGAFRVYPARGFANPGVFDFENRLRMRNVFHRASLSGDRGRVILEGTPDIGWTLREQLRAGLLENLALTDTPGNLKPAATSAGVIPALIFGDRFFLSSELMRRLAATNLIHSLALSGQHLIVAGFFAFFLVGLAGRMRPNIFLLMPRRKLLLIAALPFAALYLWIGNAPPSLLRAALMLGLFAFWLLRDRAYTPVDALFDAVVCISLLSPLSVHDMGLQLSVFSVAAIAAVAPALERLLPSARGSLPRSLVRRGMQILCISLSIQVALLPLLLLFFGNAGPWFFLNVFWLPVLDCLVMPLAAAGTLLAALGANGSAGFILQAALTPCDGLLAGLDFLARHGLLNVPSMLRPHWTALPAFACAGAALALLHGRSALPPAGHRLFAAAALLLCIGPCLRYMDTAGTDFGLRLMDVGQGQAVLLEMPEHRRALIDGGGLFSPRFDIGKDVLAPALSANEAPYLDWIINSHPDRDHLYGLFYLLKNFRVDNFASNGDTSHKNADSLAALLAVRSLEPRALHAGQRIEIGKEACLEVLHPPVDYKGSRNNASLVLRLLWKNKPLALIPGDAEVPALRRLIASGADLRAPVLILPHHGGISGFLPQFYDAVGAGFALAGNGSSLRYPAEKVRRALAERGIRLLETRKDGQIHVLWDTRGGMKIETARQITQLKDCNKEKHSGDVFFRP